jgi:hypothetical protein
MRMELNLAGNLEVCNPFHHGIMKPTTFAPKARVSSSCCYTYNDSHRIIAPKKWWSLGSLSWNQLATLWSGWSSVTRMGCFNHKVVEHDNMEHTQSNICRSEVSANALCHLILFFFIQSGLCHVSNIWICFEEIPAFHFYIAFCFWVGVGHRYLLCLWK